MKRNEPTHYGPENTPGPARHPCTKGPPERSDRTTPTIDLVTCPGCIHAMIDTVLSHMQDLTPL